MFTQEGKAKWVDMFCGSGGTSYGILQTDNSQVVVAINHDEYAILSHGQNHPESIHLNDNIEDIDVEALAQRTGKVFGIWMSAECTHFSGAKGGQSRDADSRSLSDELERYTLAFNPECMIVENVREFLTWGPLIHKKKGGKKLYDKKGKPVMVPDPKHKGIYYDAWVKKLTDLGFDYDWKLRNAADFGARTSRTRYFGVFVRRGTMPVPNPMTTHAKDPEPGSGLDKWLPVRDVLELENHGASILFGRQGKKPLVDNTLARIQYGAEKYFGGDGDTQFIIKQWTGDANSQSLDEPHHTITTRPCGNLVTMSTSSIPIYGPAKIWTPPPLLKSTKGTEHQFMMKYHGGHNATQHVYPITDPHHTITTWGNHRLVTVKQNPEEVQMIVNYHYKIKPSPVDAVLPTIMAKREMGLATVQYINKGQYGPDAVSNLDSPAPTITASRHYPCLVTAQYLTKHYGSGGNPRSQVQEVGVPLHTIPTKDNFQMNTVQYLTKYHCSNGNPGINVQNLDTPLHTIPTKDTFQLATIQFLSYYYGAGTEHRVGHLDHPVGAITTNPMMRLNTLQFVTKHYAGEYNNAPLGSPCPTITTNPKLRLVTYLTKDYTGKLNVGSIDDPIGSLMTNAKFNLCNMLVEEKVPADGGTRVINGYEVSNNIVDIKMRMLTVDELKQAQGFPKDYVLLGGTTRAKKFIGNSVPPVMAEVLCRSAVDGWLKNNKSQMIA